MEQPDIRKIWQKTLILLKDELTSISYETWIKPLDPVQIASGELLLLAPSDFHRSFVEQYTALIRNTIKVASGRDYPVRFVLPTEAGRAARAADAATTRTEAAAVARAVSEKSETRPAGQLNPQYTFDSFVVGGGNRFAHAACVAVAEKQGGRNFNPLFLYGGSGLGKTHLSHAIGNYMLEKSPSKKVLYVQCEQFVNEFIWTIQENKYDEFRNRYRKVDMLLIDDIQFIEGKVQTQVEFFHTFNALYESGRNIVMTCDKPPSSLTSLEERLRTRFSSGLTVDIQPPDFETRVAILRRRAQANGIEIPDDVYDYIATNVATNIRELEGAFNTFLCYSMLAGSKSLDAAKEALKDIIQPLSARVITLDMIQDLVTRYYRITVDDLKSNRRSKEVAVPRQVAMYLCRNLLNMTYPQIGQEFGNRDHTTVMHGCAKVHDDIQNGGTLSKDVEELRKRLDH